MRAVSRRIGVVPEASGTTLTFKDIRLDLGAYRAFKDGTELELTNKEFELLRMLLMRPGALVRRDEVVRAIWNMSLSESGKTLDVHVSGLRKKLGDDARRPSYIETVRSVGFRLATEPG
jgi:DNA-binding response OmpR family regulator